MAPPLAARPWGRCTSRQAIRFAETPNGVLPAIAAIAARVAREKACLSSQSAYDCPFWSIEVNTYALTSDAAPICTIMSAFSGYNQPKSNGALPLLAAFALSIPLGGAEHLDVRRFRAGYSLAACLDTPFPWPNAPRSVILRPRWTKNRNVRLSSTGPEPG